jgi:hypothetical protein
MDVEGADVRRAPCHDRQGQPREASAEDRCRQHSTCWRHGWTSAPAGTYWAVGADGFENGGLYLITPE